MQCIAIKTRIFLPPKDDLFSLIDECVCGLREKDVLVVTSKIVSIAEGRCMPIGSKKDFLELRKSESEKYVEGEEAEKNPYGVSLVHGAFIPNAGIDESNGNGYWTLLPKDPWQSCREIREHVQKKFDISELGVIIVDSFGLPFRKGMLGISLGFSGIDPIVNYAGRKDIFGRTFRAERGNTVDAIASMSALVMGEGDECQPMAIVRDVPGMTLSEKDWKEDFFIEPEEDVYFPLFKNLT